MSGLLDIVNGGVYDRTVGNDHFFGENCLLLEEARRVLRGEEPYEEFQQACQKLCDQADSFCQVYGRGDSDRRVWEQGKHLLFGLSKAVLAACKPGSNIDFALAKQAVEAFDLAWPAGQSPPSFPLPSGCSDAFRDYCREIGTAQTTGFWIVWDILDGLVPEYTYPDGQSRPEVRTASVPILFYGLRGTSQAAQLTVELIFDGGHGFRPDPLGLGLTALWRGGQHTHQHTDQPDQEDPGDFFEAMLRAWRTSGLDTEPCRGRWKITAFRPPDQEPHEAAPFATPYLMGRSAEAAACCALRAARGGLPGKAQETPLQLDPWGTVTAMLADEQGEQSPLGKVLGLPGKLKAARDAGVQMVLVASDQPEDDFQDHRQHRPKDPVPTKTVGEAFEHLLAYGRMIGAHQLDARDQWLGRGKWSESREHGWEPGTAEEDLEALDQQE
ncbi:MAG: hypothetical protein ACE5K7_06640 [Phycisphaerae bacterium]